MARTAYPIATQLQHSFTTPPKAYDIKFYSEYIDPVDDFNWDPEKIFFSFTFDEEELSNRSPAYEFLIEVENIDTGVIKNFVQLHDRSFYRFWQRQAEVYTESPIGDEIDLTEEAIVNARIIVTPINDFGDGEPSVFLLPFRDMVWTRSKDNRAEGTFSVLNNNWALVSDTPEDRVNRPKIIYLYLDVSESDVVSDRRLLSKPEWAYNSLTNYKTINLLTYRWLINDTQHRKLTKLGWTDSTTEEQEFITDLIQTMLPAYRDYMTNNNISADEPMMFKMAVENPRDNRDSVLIYLMKETRWQP